MKKLFLLLVITMSLNLTAQVENEIRFEFNRIYNDTGVVSPVKSSLIFSGFGATELRVMSIDGLDVKLNRISEITEGRTKSGYKFLEAEFSDEEGETIYIQLFLDIEYGIRMVFPTGSFQFI